MSIPSSERDTLTVLANQHPETAVTGPLSNHQAFVLKGQEDLEEGNKLYCLGVRTDLCGNIRVGLVLGLAPQSERAEEEPRFNIAGEPVAIFLFGDNRKAELLTVLSVDSEAVILKATGHSLSY